MPVGSVDVLFQGLGLRLNAAPIGFSTVALVKSADSGNTLVDTGAHPTRAALIMALRDRGLKPADIDTVVLTHLHFDHCENVRLFSASRVIVHALEVDEARDGTRLDPYLADFWSELLEDCDAELMEGSSLHLGECVEVVHLPGHRHGQLAVKVITSEGVVICASDVAKNARELLLGEPVLSDPDMRAEARRSVAWLLNNANMIIPGHDRPLRIVEGKPEWNVDQDILTSLY